MPGDNQVNQNISILFEDSALVAVNKPAGLRTIPDGYQPLLPCLHHILEEKYGKLWVLHRLDKDTSGVILFAKTPEAHRNLSIQFERHTTQKVYHALVIGTPPWNDLEAVWPLRVDGDRQHRTVIDTQTGKPANTRLHVIERYSDISLISATPGTGYTHQIRAHCAATGFPVALDPLYKLRLIPASSRPTSNSLSTLPIQRTALHAYQITFSHPLTSREQTITAPYPADLSDTIALLNKNTGAID